MGKSNGQFYFAITSSRRTKTGISVVGRVRDGYIKQGNPINLINNYIVSPCFVKSIYVSGKHVPECFKGQSAIIDLYFKSETEKTIIGALEDAYLTTNNDLGAVMKRDNSTTEEIPNSKTIIKQKPSVSTSTKVVTTSPQKQTQEAWGVIGEIEQTNWSKDFPMSLKDGIWSSKPLIIRRSFKLRCNCSWKKNLGGVFLRFDQPFLAIPDGVDISLDFGNCLCQVFYDDTYQKIWIKKIGTPKTAIEKEFENDCRVCVSLGGGFSPTELFVLECIRDCSGMSPDVSARIIDNLVKKIPTEQNELTYFKAVSMCLLDGYYLTFSERYLLNRLRLILDISENRASDIEKICAWDSSGKNDDESI